MSLPMHIQYVMHLSTRHMPLVPWPDFGSLPALMHRDGWVVFVNQTHAVILPRWISKIYHEACIREAIMIYFDDRAAAVEQFKIYRPTIVAKPTACVKKTTKKKRGNKK